MLAQVRDQRKQLANRPRIEKAQREANVIFDEARGRSKGNTLRKP